MTENGKDAGRDGRTYIKSVGSAKPGIQKRREAITGKGKIG